MRTGVWLPAAWRARLSPLEVFVCIVPSGGDWSYLLALDGRMSWWAR